MLREYYQSVMGNTEYRVQRIPELICLCKQIVEREGTPRS